MMRKSRPGTRWSAGTIAAVLAVASSSCGTLLYPERHGQKEGRLDPAVAILDGIGLLFFIVPGLIAFAVDFATGAIYLPPGSGESSDATLSDWQRVELYSAPTAESVRDTIERERGVTIPADPSEWTRAATPPAPVP